MALFTTFSGASARRTSSPAATRAITAQRRAASTWAKGATKL